MKRVFALALTCMLAFGVPAITVSASSLDDVVNGQTQQTDQAPVNNQDANVEQGQSTTNQNYQTGTTGNYNYVNEIKSAADLSGTSTGVSKVNEGIKKIASWIVQVLSYGITALLAARVLIDLCYITLPFTRSILANGYMGSPEMGGGMQQPGMQGGMGGMGMGSGMGMGGMGMGGMGMGGMGMRGGYGMGRMGGMGMGGMGMGGMQGGMQGAGQANPMPGRIQWVSTQALNAAASEATPGPDGKMQNALKIYAKDMAILLVIAPVLIVLAVTGTLTNLGLLIGEMLANAISSIGSMV